jgi:hypothetical protein
MREIATGASDVGLLATVIRESRRVRAPRLAASMVPGAVIAIAGAATGWYVAVTIGAAVARSRCSARPPPARSFAPC